jgi:hypothetical protein
MTRFATQFEASAARQLMNLHGESVEFIESGEVESITRNAMIERDPIALSQIINEGSPSTIVGFLNHATDGITPAMVNTDTNMIRLPIQVGEDPVYRQVLKVISSNGGMIRLLV